MLDPQQAVPVAVVIAVFEFAKFAITKIAKGSNGRSGDKDPSFWTATFREVIEEVMDRRNVTIRLIVREELDRKL